MLAVKFQSSVIEESLVGLFLTTFIADLLVPKHGAKAQPKVRGNQATAAAVKYCWWLRILGRWFVQ